MNEKLLKVLLGLFIVCFFAMIIGAFVFKWIQLHRTLKMLTTTEPQSITVFKMYPRVMNPVGPPVNFSGSDRMVGEFLQAISDFRYTFEGGSSVASADHMWTVKIAIRGGRGDAILIRYYIPSKGDDFVLGDVTKMSLTNKEVSYGAFYSRSLFQWYQKYSHLWLKPH